MREGAAHVVDPHSVTEEEKPFVDIDELKQLPTNVALAFASTGERTLPATYLFLRPLWIFSKYAGLAMETPWLDWPEALRRSYDLDSIPQVFHWAGRGKEALEASEVLTLDQLLVAYLQAFPDAVRPPD